MGTYRSKEDDVAKISTTVYVINFPESISAKELFHSCKVYGHVVDSFIPNKKAKNGAKDDNKGAGESMNAKNYSFSNDHVLPKGTGIYKGGNSYAKVLKGDRLTGDEDVVKSLAVVLDDVCLMKRDLSNAILGRVNEFASLANLKMALCNEGFVDIKIQYMGEFWVMMEFVNKEMIKKFCDNVSVGSWFLIVKDATLDFQTEKRIVWVETEGIPFKLWTGYTFKCIAAKWGELLDVDDQENSCFHSKQTPGWVSYFVEESNDEDLDEVDSNDDVDKDQDPNLFGDDDDIEGCNENNFVHVGADIHLNEDGNDSNKSKRAEGIATSRNNKDHMKSKDDSTNSVSSCHFKKSEAPRTEGSILGLLDEVVKVGEIMGYKIEGCMSNMAEIIKVQGAKERCWGNLTFDYVHSAVVDKSGGILCVWDPNCFCKENVTMSDSFVMVRGVWRWTGQKYMLIAVYAPHDTKDKHMLWDYLQPNMFNSFIMNSGLVEVNLGGCSFTWCHKSALKMSKLDRFLISKSLVNTCSNINAITLERYFSDHRPILLREAYIDYGPIPFKIFHYWFEMDGFNKMVEGAWKEYPGKESNAIRYFMGKLKYLKGKIREWNVTSRSSVTTAKAQYKNDLVSIDDIIDRGDGDDEVIGKRVYIINKLHDIDNIQSMEMAQKTKIRWAVEGDENSSFFHGMLNKKRNILNVRGVMVDGTWIDNPNRMKREFLDHFNARFCQPCHKGATIQMEFPKKLSDEEIREIKCDVTNDEIKRVVWDCGTDKAPGPDGFTFGFFRRFWDLIKCDVFDAVRPISLIGSLYKIIAKILANRLVGVLNVIVNEKQALIFKVDFEKAYDSVRWDFLDDVLRKFGFGDKWCVHVDGDMVKSAAGKLGCLVLKNPFSYLGSIVGGRMSRKQSWSDIVEIVGVCMSRKQSWSDIVERVKKRLSKWKMQTLSIGGRLSLVKSVLGSMPIFNFSIFKVPRCVLRELEGIRRQFFNGHESNSKKATRVNWKKDLLSKERGGLVVSSLYAMNRGLLFKWIWRFCTQGNTLWARIIKAMHGVDGRIGVNSRVGITSCWTSITKETNMLSMKGIDLMQYMRIKVGNGESTAFWEDKWCEEGALKPTLSYSFRRHPRGGCEQDQLQKLEDLVSGDVEAFVFLVSYGSGGDETYCSLVKCA
nr:RNA-directed DNA polymerase, eukaryota [Tanacetum cinerariifolium]